MTAKQDALVEVVDLIHRHDLTLEEISTALKEPAEFRAEKSSGILSRVFGYIGGIFVFAGLCIFVQMKWDDLDSMGRILVTLGPGFCAFVLALVCTTDLRFEKAATPLFLVAAVLQPAGIVVMMREYAHGADPEYGVLFMCLVMAIQQGFTFWAKNRTVLALTAIIFGLGFFSTAFDIMHVRDNLIGVVMGISLMCIAWSLDHSRHKSIAGLAYFFGSLLFLSAAWDWIRHTSVEVLFLALSCGIIFLSTVARSRSLLLVGTFALLFYLGDYIYENFKDNLGAPIMLMLVGFLLIGVGAVAVKINNKYIKQKG